MKPDWDQGIVVVNVKDQDSGFHLRFMKISFSQRQKLYEQDLKADLWIKCRASDALILIEANENPREETGLGLARKTAETLL